VHAGVGPSGDGQLNRAAEHGAQRPLQVLLHGALVGLARPAVQGAAVVGDAQPETDEPAPPGGNGLVRVLQVAQGRSYFGSGAASPPGASTPADAASSPSAALISAAAASASSGETLSPSTTTPFSAIGSGVTAPSS